MQKAPIKSDLTAKAAAVEAGVAPNPIFVCCAGAAYETTRALRLFMGEASSEATLQFSELPSADRQEMIDDAMQVIGGATPPDLYAKYARGILWNAVDPLERAIWTTFVATVQLQFEAIKHIAAATQPNEVSDG